MAVDRTGLLLNCTGENALGRSILELITGSKGGDSLSIITPILEEDAAINALLAARARGVRIRVITRLAEHRDGRLRFITRGFDPGESLAAHFEATRRLTHAAIRLKSPSLLPHAKLVVASGRAAIFSSANLTANALGFAGNASIEAGIQFDHPDEIRHWQEAFTALWNSCQLAQDLYDKNIVIQSTAHSGTFGEELPATVSAGLRLHCFYPPQRQELLTELIAHVERARKEIILAALSFYDLDRIPALRAALLAALRRGVRVTAVVRPEQFPPNQYPDAATRSLIESGLCLAGVTGLHAKAFLVDSEICGMTSANFNPYSLGAPGTASNLELAISGPCALQKLVPVATFLESLVETPTHRWSAGR